MKGIRVQRQRRALHIAQIVALITLAVAVNLLAAALTDRFPLTWDMTANTRYALSDQSRDFAALLKKDVCIHVLARRDTYRKASSYTAYAAALIEQYPKYGPVTVDYVDFAQDPTFAARFEMPLAENDLLVTCEDRAVQLKTSDLFEYSYSQSGEIQVRAIGEAKLAAAIMDAVVTQRAGVTVLTGNGAQNAEGLQALLEDNSFDVTAQSLALGVPDDVRVAVLIAPTSDLTKDQVEALDAWLFNGGQYGRTLFYAADVTQGPLPNLEAYLREWGAQVDDGAVFETSQARTSHNQPFFATAGIADPILDKAFADAGAPVIVPMARPLTALFDTREGYSVSTVLTFSETSGVRPSDAPEGFTATDAKRWGPIPAMLACRLEAGEGRSSSIYVCGSASLYDSTILQGDAFLNRRLLVRLFTGAGGGTDTSNFVGRMLTDDVVHIPTSRANALGVLLGIAVPLAIVAAGIAVYLRRRRL